MNTAIKQPWASVCSNVKNYHWRLNPVSHRMLHSCTYVATVGVKGLIKITYLQYLLTYLIIYTYAT